MYSLTFLVSLPLFVIAAVMFCYALARMARNDDQRARNIMTVGYGVGLLGVVVAAVVFGFF